MKKLIAISLFIGLMSSAAYAGGGRTFGDVGTWHYLFATWKAGENWTTHLYIDNEKFEEGKVGSLWNLRFRRKINEKFKIGLNYGQYHVTGGVNAHRPEISLFYCEKYKGITFNNRARLENWIQEGSDKFKYRYRQMLSVGYKVNDDVNLGFAEEFMWRSGYSVDPLPWDQEFDAYQQWFEPVWVGYKINKMHKFKAYFRYSSKQETVAELMDLDNAKKYIGLAYFINFK